MMKHLPKYTSSTTFFSETPPKNAAGQSDVRSWRQKKYNTQTPSKGEREREFVQVSHDLLSYTYKPLLIEIRRNSLSEFRVEAPNNLPVRKSIK